VNHRTHRNVAKLLYPDSSWKQIDEINSIIDNPSQRSIAFNQSFTTSAIDPKSGKLTYYNPYDVFNLGKKSPHRRVNHDPISSAVMGFMSHGSRGSSLGNLHVMLDVVSEDWKRNFGVSERDFMEAHMNHFLETQVLPRLIAQTKLKQSVINEATKLGKKKYYSRDARERRILMSQNMHKAFIPTKTFYH
jgi:hypothetical protein